MAWFYLIAAGLFEIGWPVGLKRSQTPGRRPVSVGSIIAGIVGLKRARGAG